MGCCSTKLAGGRHADDGRSGGAEPCAFGSKRSSFTSTERYSDPKEHVVQCRDEHHAKHIVDVSLATLAPSSGRREASSNVEDSGENIGGNESRDHSGTSGRRRAEETVERKAGVVGGGLAVGKLFFCRFCHSAPKPSHLCTPADSSISFVAEGVGTVQS